MLPRCDMITPPPWNQTSTGSCDAGLAGLYTSASIATPFTVLNTWVCMARGEAGAENEDVAGILSRADIAGRTGHKFEYNTPVHARYTEAPESSVRSSRVSIFWRMHSPPFSRSIAYE